MVYNPIARLFHDPVGIVIGSAFVLILVWGLHGEVQILDVWDGWAPASDDPNRASVIRGLPWDQEWLAFLIGFALLVIVPCLFIRLRFHHRLADYGLALPPPDRLRFAFQSATALLLVSAPFFLIAAGDRDMKGEYPLYRGGLNSDLDFFIYEVGYLLFFVVIEFVFRGYLLFGLYQFRDKDATEHVAGEAGPLLFGHYAIYVAMLSYTAWHLGKPTAETFGTIPWGLAAGAVALESRSVVPIIVIHWLLNVFLDLAIREGWSLPFTASL